MGVRAHLRVLADLVGFRPDLPQTEVTVHPLIVEDLLTPICEHAFILEGKYIVCWRCGHREWYRP
jgi:hypothetical protein